LACSVLARHGVAGVINPLRSEQEAFRFLIYVIVVVGAVVGVVLIVRSLL
jgi:hypothetical protein